MATVYHDKSADLSLIRSKKVAIVGYGRRDTPTLLTCPTTEWTSA